MRLFGYKVGIHRMHNRFPHILWRYFLPRNLMSKNSPYKLYKWLWLWIQPLSTTKNF